MACIVEPLVDRGDLSDPLPSQQVVESHDLVVVPVEVVCDVGHLPDHFFRGVADHSPTPLSTTSNRSSQFGHVTATLPVPLSLIRRYRSSRCARSAAKRLSITFGVTRGS